MGIRAFPTSLSPKVIFQIFSGLYAILLQSVESDSSSANKADGKPENVHYCSLQRPCTVAYSLFSQVYKLRLVSRDWNFCFFLFCSSSENRFFRRVEDAYYPHAWHINTKIRKAVLLGRYRIFNTIDTEDGECLMQRRIFDGIETNRQVNEAYFKRSTSKHLSMDALGEEQS